MIIKNGEAILGECLEAMKQLSDNSVDAIVTDPPYGLSFMGKKWDYDVPSVEIWQEALRVLKPGGYLLAFAGTRTQHRMAVRIEDAGFEIRDMIAWVYGSGFPKSLNIGKAVDKLRGNYREDLGQSKNARPNMDGKNTNTYATRKHSNATKGNSEWEGFGTALKPALEPITVARKPLSEKTVAENCLKWGVGGIDIDGSRNLYKGDSPAELYGKSYMKSGYGKVNNELQGISGTERNGVYVNSIGRFPANLIHDGSDEVTSLFPNNNARFFYCPKTSKSERNAGCEEMEEKRPDERTETGMGTFAEKGVAKQSNFHPTVKPTALMEYLIKMVTKENYTVLDPFMGSGSTILACENTNRKWIGIEMNEEYFEIAKNRISNNSLTLPIKK